MTDANRLFIALQHCLPKHLLSTIVGHLCRIEGGRLTRLVIEQFIRVYGVDMKEAARGEPREYATFNAFFTRALKSDARPPATDARAFVSPADGMVSQSGVITAGRLFQAKGLNYDLYDLFDGERALAERFAGGSFATIYLAPHNYHRVHMPAAATPRYLRYVPGALYSVNSVTTRSLPNLFSRNERVIVVCDSGHESFALIMVGALNVGSIELTFVPDAILRNRPLTGLQPKHTVPLDVPALARGAEFGRFNMGSTVIVLASPGWLTWDELVKEDLPVRVGQRLAYRQAD